MTTGIFLARWDELLDRAMPDSDIYFSESYCRLYETDTAKCQCFYFFEGEKHFFLPIIIDEFIHDEVTYYDFESPHGYSGPLTNFNEPSFLAKAFDEFERLLIERDVVAGVIRFHPLLQNGLFLSDYMKMTHVQNTLAIDLRMSEDKILLDQVHPKHRNSIRKAEKSGLHFVIDTELRTIDKFRELYTSTMDRVKANEFYKFSDKYFEDIAALKGNIFVANVIHERGLAASALILHGSEYGHYHLAASDPAQLKYGANNFLVFNCALYCKHIGNKWLHLGGGLSASSDDPLFRFKSRFSSGNFEHFIGGLVVNKIKYSSLCEDWDQSHPEVREKFKNHLLRYRKG